MIFPLFAISSSGSFENSFGGIGKFCGGFWKFSFPPKTVPLKGNEKKMKKKRHCRSVAKISGLACG
ncbi:MAG: hypothetical protein ACRBBO_15400 [Cognatishimia sp.]